jgi:hypothetical protein
VHTVIRLVLPDGDIQDVAVTTVTPEVSLFVMVPASDGSAPRAERVVLHCDKQASAGGKLVYI